MGDKSPKSKQKSQNQKQIRNDGVQKEKQRIIDSKKVIAPNPKKK
ncbi:hypothetical protein [Puniceicoccus vermicola]|nr:hypothetical protein [Puniceicoccus vermicola]